MMLFFTIETPVESRRSIVGGDSSHHDFVKSYTAALLRMRPPLGEIAQRPGLEENARRTEDRSSRCDG